VDYFAVSPLAPLHDMAGDDLPHQRHFLKSNGAMVYDSSILGQVKLAGQIDFADYPYETPYAYDNQTTTRPVAPYTFSVRAASTANVASLSG
ncbi:hypothetical protein ACI4B7_26880, partial [Klebsiella pneumoniae]|uniref:hypothetical protein n=1 Tax=Klebsiella pneumoniae TaxID=573 RepID=UPI003853CBF3